MSERPQRGRRSTTPFTPPVKTEWQVFIMQGQSLMHGAEFYNLTSTANDQHIVDFFNRADDLVATDNGRFINYVKGRDADTQNGDYPNMRLNYKGMPTVGGGPPDYLTGGMGPNAEFARALYAAGERNICIIRFSISGTSITMWIDPETEGALPPPDGLGYIFPDQHDYTQKILDQLTANGDTYRLRGMVWFQGHRDGREDGYDTTYEYHNDQYKSQVRARFGASLKWLTIVSPLFGSYPGYVYGNGRIVQETNVQNGQRASAAKDPFNATVESDFIGYDMTTDDYLHPNGFSTATIGANAAAAWLATGW